MEGCVELSGGGQVHYMQMSVVMNEDIYIDSCNVEQLESEGLWNEVKELEEACPAECLHSDIN